MGLWECPGNKKHSGWPTFLVTRWQQWGRSGCKKANAMLNLCRAKFGLHSKKDRDISSQDKYSLPVVLILQYIYGSMSLI